MESISLPPTTERSALFDALMPQLSGLLGDEHDPIAAMANFAAALHTSFGWHWTGFYRVVRGELVLGPFQGPVACTRIAKGRGVCGTAWAENRTVLVPDVDRFPGHITCSPLSRSEVVVPLRDAAGRVVAVLDIDSAVKNDFSDEDARRIEEACRLLEPLLA